MKVNNIKIFLFSILLTVLIGAGCSFTDPQTQEQVKEALHDKGLDRLLSPEEYREIIDIELAKLTREKLISPENQDKVMIEEVEVSIQEIKNDCNLGLPETIVLSSNLEQKLNLGYVCRYVKGSMATRGRTDNFIIKFFNEHPFEFGIDDQITFPTDFGYLKLKDITGNSLVERQAKIITLSGEVYLESAGPALVVGNSQNASDFDDDFNVVVGLKEIKEKNANSKIYLILPHDDGKRGERVGCGDSLIDVGVAVNFTSSDKASKIKIVLNKLFEIDYKEYSTDPLIINPLYKSHLSVETVKVTSKKVYVSLVGDLKLSGICDTPRYEEQIKAIAKQFGGVEIVEIVINPLSEKDFF